MTHTKILRIVSLISGVLSLLGAFILPVVFAITKVMTIDNIYLFLFMSICLIITGGFGIKNYFDNGDDFYL